VKKLPSNWQSTELNQDSEIALNELANIGSVHRKEGAASYMLVSVLIHVS
jgi:hypothetical protein